MDSYLKFPINNILSGNIFKKVINTHILNLERKTV